MHNTDSHDQQTRLTPRQPETTPEGSTFTRPAGSPAGDADSTAPGRPTVPAGSLTVPERIGRYQIRRSLGEGAFGRVYHGYDPELGREVAIKVPLPDALTPALRERFLREARAAATVHHPNVCPVYDVGTEGDLPYFVMRFVPGPTLATHLARRTTPFPPRDAAGIVRKLALGVAAAHARGIVHRDLKPQNVLLDEEQDEVFVTDFGMARVGGETRLTGEGDVLGTPSYMSPEQARGEAGTVGPLSDVYSLGVILYRMLTGETPFRGTVPEIIAQVRETDPPPPSAARPGLDPRVSGLCMRAMAKAPADRFPTVAALADALDGYVRAGAPVARPPAPGSAELADTRTVVAPPRGTTSRPGRKRVWAGVVVSVVVAGAVAVGLWNPFREPSPDQTTQQTDPVIGTGPPRTMTPPVVPVTTVSDRFAGHKFDQAAERRAAVWVRSIGGLVGILPDGSTAPVMVKDVADLPPAFRVRDIVVQNNPLVTDEGIKEHLAGLSGPIAINLSLCANVTGDGVAVLAQIPGLTQLTFNGQRRVSDTSLQVLTGHPALENLSFDATAMTPTGLAPVGSLPRLTVLGLADLPITDEAIMSVARATKLEALNLSNTRPPGRITTAGWAHLKSLGNLRELVVARTGIDGDGLARLAGLPALENLILNDTKIEDDDLVHLKSFPRLNYVNLQGTRVTDAGMAHLVACPALERVYLAVTAIGDEGARMLARRPTLKSVFLDGTRVTDDGVKALVALPKLEQIAAMDAQVTNAGLESLSRCPTLRRVSLKSHAVTDTGVSHLARLKQLEVLILLDAEVSDESVAVLSQLTRLRWLWLDTLKTRITAKGLRDLRTALPNCTFGPAAPSDIGLFPQGD